MKARNPWHDPENPYSKEYHHYESIEGYRGFLVGHHINEHGEQWDIVKGGVIRGMYNGPNGARKEIDRRLDR